MTAEPRPILPQSWAPFDLGLHAFLAVNPLALGLWTFSLAPLVGGNLFIAVALAGVVMLLGAIVVGSLAARWPWTGGDYAWQTRFLDRRIGAILALCSWWLVVALLAPVYGNVILVQVIDPLLTYAEWNGLASWFRGREGIFTASLLAIAVATAFAGLGMRRAAIAQRVVVVIGSAALVAILVLFLSGGPGEFRDAFDDRSAEIYGTSPLASSQIVEIGSLDASVTEVEPLDTLRLVPLALLFSLWIGWAGPLVGEVRMRRPDAVRHVLIRAATASTLVSLLFFVAIGRGITWDLWNEANNLYWGTVYGTTPATPLPAWPNPVVFATWLTDSSTLQYAVILGMSAWVLGWIATLFLPATRVLLAAANDNVLPRSVARTTGDWVPLLALALLVVPACALAALDAYWDAFAEWSSIGVVALALTTLASGVAAVSAFRRENRRLTVASATFVTIVSLVIGVWVLDPVYGMRTLGSLVFLAALYTLAAVVSLTSRRAKSWRPSRGPLTSDPT
jgi:amino acid transporter